MGAFASQLKKLRKERNIRQRDLAASIGLAQTTIANYEQGTRFPDEQTLSRLSEYFHVSFDFLLCRDTPETSGRVITQIPLDEVEDSGRTDNQLSDRFLSLLLSCNQLAAGELLQQKKNDGMDIREIYMRLIQPSLRKVGRLWSVGKLDVCEEHFISHACQKFMSQLMAGSDPQYLRPYTFVGITAGEEMHNIGIQMVSDFLRLEGWNTLFLGGNLPTASVLRALSKHKVEVIGISISVQYHLNPLRDCIYAVRNDPVAGGTKILVGGLAFQDNPKLFQDIDADGYAPDAATAVEIANRLISHQTDECESCTVLQEEPETSEEKKAPSHIDQR